MARYYFDTPEEGLEVLHDPDGVELEHVEAARIAAARALWEVARDELRNGSPDCTMQIRVRDEHARPLLKVSLFFTTQELA